ncbi:hypothetical protein [Streptomyces sp. NRRL S-1824]|uniref:hypothetical protein n=1 Tax=Streptomyces sp. NRRL S-1824 TaxID=1463889 RepID=UPI0004C526B3|nr:hypothetical protein [Streptomyces sp. NRRL S-1824]
MEALQTREAAARGRVEELREQLTAAESEVSRLVITRQTVEEVLAAPSGALPPGVEPVPVAGLSRAAALLVAAETGGDATVTSPAYRRIAAVFAERSGPLRCKEVCAGLGEEATASRVESMRSKLKRLVERGVLLETEPGLFTLAGTDAR